MSQLSERIRQAWAERDGPVVLTTVNQEGVPNAIYASSVTLFADQYLVVADNYFDKTRRNILDGSGSCSILFMTKAGKAFQAVGKLAYHRDGPIFDDMKKWNSERHPGVAALALEVTEVYSGAERIL